MAKTATFFPAPSEFSAVISVRLYGITKLGDGWRALSAEIAEQFNCDADDLHVEQCLWLDGERFADFVSLDGRIIGSLDDKLDPPDWLEFYGTRIADPDAFFSEVRAAAKARALVSAN